MTKTLSPSDVKVREALQALCDVISATEEHGDDAHDEGCSICKAHKTARAILDAQEAAQGVDSPALKPLCKTCGCVTPNHNPICPERAQPSQPQGDFVMVPRNTLQNIRTFSRKAVYDAAKRKPGEDIELFNYIVGRIDALIAAPQPEPHIPPLNTSPERVTNSGEMQQIAPASGESQASMYQHTYPLGAPFREDDLQPESGDARELMEQIAVLFRASNYTQKKEDAAALLQSFAARIRAEVVEECARSAYKLSEDDLIAEAIRSLKRGAA